MQVDELFQHLGALQTTEDLEKRGSQARGIDGIEDGPHLRIGRDMLDAIDRAEVVVGVAATEVERQQGRVFEREHGEGRHQDIGQGDFNLT